jgi:hypothetical protein
MMASCAAIRKQSLASAERAILRTADMQTFVLKQRGALLLQRRLVQRATLSHSLMCHLSSRSRT